MKSLELARGPGCILGNVFYFFFFSHIYQQGNGIDTTVTGGGAPFGEKKIGLLGPEFSGWVGWARNACISCSTKHSAPIYPGRNPRPGALMDLGMNGTQSEMVSNTQL